MAGKHEGLNIDNDPNQRGNQGNPNTGGSRSSGSRGGGALGDGVGPGTIGGTTPPPSVGGGGSPNLGSGGTNGFNGGYNAGSRSELDDGSNISTASCVTSNVCVPILNVPDITKNLANGSSSQETKHIVEGLTVDADKIDKIICSTTLVSDILKLDENVLDKTSFNNLEPNELAKFQHLTGKLTEALRQYEPINEKVKQLEPQALTEKLVEGKGTFDWIIGSVYNQLDNLRKNNLITNQEFSTIYSQNLTGILEIASNHLLQAEQAYWQNQLIKEQVVNAQYENLKKQAELIALPLVLEQQYAQTLSAVKQVDLLAVQIETERAKLPQIQAQTLNMIEQTRLTKAQWHKTAKEAKLVDATLLETKAKIKLMAEQIKKEKENLDLIKAQVAEAYARIALVAEQMKAAKAQYSDTIDGKPVRGVIGTQNALHRKQSLSYDRDSLYKLISLQAQGWQTKKTADIGTKSPAVFTAASVDGIFEQYLATYYNNPGALYPSFGTGSQETANGSGSHDVYGRVDIGKLKPVVGYSDYVTDAEMDSEKETNVGNTPLN